MKDPLGVSPSKGNQGTTRGKEKFLLTSVGIEPKTSGLDLPLLCRLSYKVGQRKNILHPTRLPCKGNDQFIVAKATLGTTPPPLGLTFQARLGSQTLPSMLELNVKVIPQ